MKTSFRMLDGVAVGAKESLKAEWMYRWDYAQTTYQSIIKREKKYIIFVIPDISFYFEYFLPEVRFVKKKLPAE